MSIRRVRGESNFNPIFSPDCEGVSPGFEWDWDTDRQAGCTADEVFIQ